jgi:hypothetical protein
VLIYIWSLAFLKLSQLALYLRVFAFDIRTQIYIVGGIVVVWAIVFNFIFLFLCDPISQQWTTNRIGHCMDQIMLLKCLIMTNLVTDLFIVVLPMRCVWKLQMRKTEKFAVIFCFGIGLVCVFISIARFILMYKISTFLQSTSSASNRLADHSQISSATLRAHHLRPSCSAPSSSCLPVSASASPCSVRSTSDGARGSSSRL